MKNNLNTHLTLIILNCNYTEKNNEPKTINIDCTILNVFNNNIIIIKTMSNGQETNQMIKVSDVLSIEGKELK